jgi:hypothetical protein
MANEEQARILQMVASGQISPAEAGDLLAALEVSSPPQRSMPKFTPPPPTYTARPI